MWYEKSIFYQFYTLGFCNAPKENDGAVVSRILKVKEWTKHLKKLNVNAVYFSPVFQSDIHGYDTKDYSIIDFRLGENKDFAFICRYLKENSIKVIIDGVFNHVGRGFWAFYDVKLNGIHSKYKDWFYINFDSNSTYNDGFSYEGWEGHYELVRLNLNNEEVAGHIFSCVRLWIEEFDIDGIRLDVAYSLSEDFMKSLRIFCDSLKKDFFLLGEMLFGDYKKIVNNEMLNSATNYECYKGLYSSFNDMNMFEINYSLNRQFSNEDFAIYKNLHLFTFSDNHDVTRIASILHNKKHIPLVYGMLFTIPGIPCIYYGSEWGELGIKEKESDDSLRPFFHCPKWTELTDFISKLGFLRKENDALIYGSYKTIFITNRQLVFERSLSEKRIWVLVNADETDYIVYFKEKINSVYDLLTGERLYINGAYKMGSYSFYLWQIE